MIQIRFKTISEGDLNYHVGQLVCFVADSRGFLFIVRPRALTDGDVVHSGSTFVHVGRFAKHQSIVEGAASK